MLTEGHDPTPWCYRHIKQKKRYPILFSERSGQHGTDRGEATSSSRLANGQVAVPWKPFSPAMKKTHPTQSKEPGKLEGTKR